MRQERYANTRDPQYAAPREDTGVIAGSSEAPVFVRRVSWGAILAGAIVMLVTHLLLSLLGLAIGVSTIDPTAESPDASTLSIGAGVWWVVASLVSVFAGSWVAGRLSGAPIRTDGLLHGVVTWGLATLVMFYLLTSAISSIVGGAFNVVGAAFGVAGEGVERATDQPQGPLADVQRQIQGLIGQAMQGVQQGTQQVQQVARDPQARQVIQKAVTSGPEALTPADREAAINAMVQHGNMTRPEAEQRLAEWQAQYQEARRQAAEAAEVTADRVTQASIWSFVALVLGAIVAAVGGSLGSPRDVQQTLRPRVA